MAQKIEKKYQAKRSFSCNKKIFERIDKALEKLELKTGINVSRGSLIEYMIVLAIESMPLIDYSTIYSEHSFWKELMKAVTQKIESKSLEII